MINCFFDAALEEIPQQSWLQLEIAAKEIAMTSHRTQHSSIKYLIVGGAVLVTGLAVLAFEKLGGSPGQDAYLPLAPQSAIVLLGGKGAQTRAPPVPGAPIAISPRQTAGALTANGGQTTQSEERTGNP